MNIAVAADHAGFAYKEEIIKYLKAKGYGVIDCGTDSDESCDYPLFGKAAAFKVAKGEAQYGVLICSSAQGIMMAANKVRGIRCGIGFNDDVSRLLRQHNDGNMIAFASKFMSIEEIFNRIDIFLNTPFEGGRHQRRVNEID